MGGGGGRFFFFFNQIGKSCIIEFKTACYSDEDLILLKQFSK